MIRQIGPQSGPTWPEEVLLELLNIMPDSENNTLCYQGIQRIFKNAVVGFIYVPN